MVTKVLILREHFKKKAKMICIRKKNLILLLSVPAFYIEMTPL